MGQLVTGQVNTLRIKPLVTYSGQKRETTITSFDDMLRGNKASEETEAAKSETAGTEKTARTDTDGTVVYRDPVTGQAVQYIEVGGRSGAASTGSGTSAAKKTSAAKQSSKTSGAGQTTTASSMKKTKYDSYFKKAAKKYGVPESLLKAIAKAESNFNAKDVSSSGAMGVMQLMPATARSLGVDNPFDPEQNIMGGAKCIAQKLKEFNGNVRLALAAYNAGSGAVRRSGGVPSACKTYVKRVLSYQKAYETAKAVG